MIRAQKGKISVICITCGCDDKHAAKMATCMQSPLTVGDINMTLLCCVIKVFITAQLRVLPQHTNIFVCCGSTQQLNCLSLLMYQVDRHATHA